MRWHSLFVAALAATTTLHAAVEKNGFDLSNAVVPIREIRSGGPPRDRIPSIDTPKFVAAGEVDYLKDDDSVLSFARDGTVRAYPLRILVWHEIVNDVVGGEPVAVTYCPLCGTAMVFAREAGGTLRSFGVSGLLYHSDVLMYDRETESLWSQLGMRAVSGPAVGSELEWLGSEQMSWKQWRDRHPDGEVLSTETGHRRNYGGDAYANYFNSDQTMFPVPKLRGELPQKDWVIGVIVDGQAKAYAVERLEQVRTLEDRIGETPVTVSYNSESNYARVTRSTGEPVPSVQVFWFAWQAFYPGTGLYR